MKKKIGIWGLGIVGKSVIRYLASQKVELQVIDKRTPTEQEQEFLDQYSCVYRPESELLSFLEENTQVIASPGVDLREYGAYAHKWHTELDLFVTDWNKPLIAVTGTVGKTSVVYLLSKILEHYGKKVATGGNIGLGMLDLVNQQNQYDVGLLELSSFQLELCKTFAPTLAVWTNFYPNHLDRHGTLAEYFNAKYKIIAQQKPTDYAVVPLELAPLLLERLELTTRLITYFSANKPQADLQALLKSQDVLYYLEGTTINKYTHISGYCPIFDINKLPKLSYAANWLILVVVCDLLKLPLEHLNTLSHVDLPAHRLDLVATVNRILFYNDSKSTIAQATLAAVSSLQLQPIYLLLGGISKGVDRKFLIEQLKNKVKKIVCFGAEAEKLYSYCLELDIPAEHYPTLQEAFNACVAQAQSGDCILLSPAGASFDLFKNYQERGDCFKRLVSNLEKSNCTKDISKT